MNKLADTLASTVDEQTLNEQKIFRYMARYGQHPETEAIYRDAILACQSIDNLELTVTDIAREYDLKPECLRNQLKRHFPEILARREQMRDMLGYSRPGNRGLKKATVEKYADAIQMLRETHLTIREVAERCNVSYQGLQQHLLFYHKDIAESRLLYRTDALLKTVERNDWEGSPSPNGGVRGPKAETVALYASALELYRKTDLTIRQIAARCNVPLHNFSSYIRKWYREDMEKRRSIRAHRKNDSRNTRKNKMDMSVQAVALRRYAPVLEMLRQGASFHEAAIQAGSTTDNLRNWVKANYPDLAKKVMAANMVPLPEGTRCKRESWDFFRDAVKEYCETDIPLKHIAGSHGMRPTSLRAFLVKHFPSAVAQRRDHEAKKLDDRRKAWEESKVKAQLKLEAYSRAKRDKYADAIELYATGDYSTEQIATRFGFSPSAFTSYLHAHYPELVKKRRAKRKEWLLQAKLYKQAERQAKKQHRDKTIERKRIYAQLLEQVFSPALSDYVKGEDPIFVIAQRYGLKTYSIQNYLKLHHPEMIQQRKENRARSLDEKYAEAVKEFVMTNLPIDRIANKYGLSNNGLRNYMKMHRPELWNQRPSVKKVAI